MLSHLFGKKNSPCIANWSLKQSVKNEAKVIQQTVNQKFYMENFLNSLSNEKDLIRITRKIINILNIYQFWFTKFVSNSPTASKSLPSSKLSAKFVNLDLGYASERALGWTWNITAALLKSKKIIQDLWKGK